MRILGPLALGFVSALLSLVALAAPESCVLAQRDPDDAGEDAPPPPPPIEAEAPPDFDGCTCCGKTLLPLLPDCAGHTAFAVAAGDCPRACRGSTAYALCEGVCYSECACDLPRGFTLVDVP